MCGWSVDTLVEALLRLIVARLVKPDVLGSQALKSTHGAAGKEGSGNIHNCKKILEPAKEPALYLFYLINEQP